MLQVNPTSLGRMLYSYQLERQKTLIFFFCSFHKMNELIYNKNIVNYLSPKNKNTLEFRNQMLQKYSKSIGNDLRNKLIKKITKENGVIIIYYYSLFLLWNQSYDSLIQVGKIWPELRAWSKAFVIDGPTIC